MRYLIYWLLVLWWGLPLHLTQGLPPSTPAPTGHTYRVIRSLPHDTEAFTQGLCISGGILYEGTGLWGHSTVRRLDLSSGHALMTMPLSPHLFGEGIAVMGDRLFQLTWVSGMGLIYSTKNLEKIGTFSYPTEGWGLTHDGRRLIMSDGTDWLHFLDPADFTIQGALQVLDAQGPVDLLNELEYVHGRILANVWKTDRIAVIDPTTGDVTAWIDLSGLYTRETGEPQPEVLNGIAHDAAKNRLYVTGKLWKRIFEIEIVPALVNDTVSHTPASRRDTNSDIRADISTTASGKNQ